MTLTLLIGKSVYVLTNLKTFISRRVISYMPLSGIFSYIYFGTECDYDLHQLLKIRRKAFSYTISIQKTKILYKFDIESNSIKLNDWFRLIAWNMSLMRFVIKYTLYVLSVSKLQTIILWKLYVNRIYSFCTNPVNLQINVQLSLSFAMLVWLNFSKLEFTAVVLSFVMTSIYKKDWLTDWK